MDLAELKFVVNTKELEAAAIKVAELGTAVSKLNKPMQNLSKESAKTNKELAKAEEAAAKAALAQTKLEQAQAKSAQTAAKSSSVLERQNLILEYMAQGNSKGQASILATAKAAGALDDEMLQLNKTLVTQRTLIGGDPFDKSIGLMQKLQNEYKTTTEVTNLFNKNLGLTQKQMTDLAREKERLVALYGIEGKSLNGLSAEYDKLIQKSVKINQANSERTNSMKAQIKAQDDAVRASTYLSAEMERVNRLTQSGGDVTSSVNNKLIKFEQALKQSGQSANEQVLALERYKTALMSIQKAAGNRQVDYLSRALGPQITDIAVGLATGQAPLTILLQQGGQLRDQFALAGVAGKDMGDMLTKAAIGMVSSVKDVALAIGGALGGAFVAAGKSVKNFIMDITGTSSALEYIRYQIALLDGSNGILMKSFLAMGGLLTGVIATGIFAAVAAFIAYGVALKEVISQESALSKAINLTGGSLGLTTDSALGLSETLAGSKGNVGAYLTAITDIAKAGNVTSDNLKTVAKTIVEVSRVTGLSSETLAKNFSKISEKPLEGLIPFAKELGTINVEILKHIQRLEKAGKYTEAAKIATDAYAGALRNAGKAIKEDMGFLEDFFFHIARGANMVWNEILNIGRATPLVKQLAKAQEELTSLQNGDGFMTDQYRKNSIQVAEAVIKGIENQITAQKKLGEVKANNVKEVVALERSLKTKDEKAIVVPMSRDISIIQKDYNEQLRLAEGFARDERSVLKARFDAGLIERAEFITKDTDLLVRSEEKQLSVIESFRGKYKKAYEEQTAALNKALGSTKDEENRKVLKLSIENLTKDFNEFNATLDDTKTKIGSAFGAREQVALLEFEKAAFASTKTFQEYARTQEDVAANKKVDLQLQDRLTNAYGAEASQIKAVAEETKKQTAEISKFTKAQEEAYKQYLIVLSNPASSLAQLEAAGGAYTTAMINANKAIAISRVSIENAGTDAVVAYYKQEYDRISNGVTDSIVTALFEGGKAGSKKFRDLITAELKKPITIMVKALVDATLGSSIQSFMGGSTGSAVGSAGGSMLGSMAASGGFVGSVASAGQYFSTGFMNTVAGTGASAGATAGASIGGANGFAMQAGAYAPYILAAVALVSLIKSLDDSGTYHTGGGSKYSAAGGLTTGNTGGEFFDVQYGKQAIDLTTNITKAVVGILDSTAVAFGKTAGYEAATSFADDTSKDGAWGALLINKMGEKLIDWNDTRENKWAPRNFSDGQQGITEYLNLVASDVRKLLIQETPGWADTMLNALGDAPTLENLAAVVNQIGMIQQAFVKFGKVLPGFANISDTSIESLLTLFGGIDNLNNSLSFFYENYFSEQEKAANLTTELTAQFRELGLELPTTREAFRALVTAAREAGDDKQVKNLLDLQQSFAQLVPVTEMLVGTVDVLTETMQDLLKERANLEVELLQVQGRTDEANAALRRIATEGFTEAEIAAYDYNQSLRDQIQSYKDADEAIKLQKENAEKLLQTRKQETDIALDSVRRAIDAEKELVQVRLDAAEKEERSIKAVFDLLSSTISDIRGQSNAAGSLSSARDLISNAINTGVLPDADKLSDALNVVRRSIESTAYATKTEQIKAGLKLANELQSLQDIAEPQLSAAERAVILAQDQLVILDNQLKQAQLQVDALRGVDTSIVSLSTAMSNLAIAISAEAAAKAAVATSNKTSTTTGSQTSAGGYNLVRTATGATLNFPGGGSHSVAGPDAVKLLTDTYGLVSGPGGSLVRTRADGGYTPPGMTLVGEDGPELVNFSRPSMVYTAAQTSSLMGGSSSEELAAIRQELIMLRAETRAVVSNTSKTAKILDRSSPDGQSLQVTVVTP